MDGRRAATARQDMDERETTDAAPSAGPGAAGTPRGRGRAAPGRDGAMPEWTCAAGWPRGSDVFVEAFAKGLAVIAAFSHERALSVSEVAQRTALSRAGARRLLHTLVTLGLARHDGDLFMLTPRVLQLGFAYLSSLSLREVAQPVIESLSRAADEVVALSVLDGTEAVYVGRAEVQSVLRRSLTIGSHVPAFCTSTGRALLAGLSPEDCAARIAASDLRPWTRLTVTDPAALAAEIAKVRAQGWSLVSEEFELGTLGIAAPVRDAEGRVVAAINLSTNLARHSPEDLVSSFLPGLLRAAAEIGERLSP